MNKNVIILSTLAVLVTFGLLFGVYKLTSQPVQTTFPQVQHLKTDDHLKWSPDKKNLLIEYSDLQCPACRSYHGYFKAIEASGSADFDITKKVTLVFRHFPLTQIHDKAILAAYAAEAAGKQGKFWEMTDVLYDQQPVWELSNNPQSEYFDKFAKDLGLDVAKFNSDFNSGEVQKRVDEDVNAGNQMGLSWTPTFFLNGQKIDSSVTPDDMKKMLKSL